MKIANDVMRQMQLSSVQLTMNSNFVLSTERHNVNFLQISFALGTYFLHEKKNTKKNFHPKNI